VEDLMNRLAVSALIAGLSLLGTAAFAEDKPEAPKEKKLCRSLEVTGSIMPKRTCHTKAEWAQIDATNAADARQFADRPRPSIGSN
jgi:hypothetical protein